MADSELWKKTWFLKTYLGGGAERVSTRCWWCEALEMETESWEVSRTCLLLFLTTTCACRFLSSFSSVPGNPNRSSVAFRFRSLSNTIFLWDHNFPPPKYIPNLIALCKLQPSELQWQYSGWDVNVRKLKLKASFIAKLEQRRYIVFSKEKD